MNNHTELLNYLARTFNLQSYLEIGVQHPENNFNTIKCQYKLGIEPSLANHNIIKCTSDEYFRDCETDNANKFDLIFIDGLHHADQVKRDFDNSLRCLSDNGFIVMHDTLPEKEEYTHVPRDSK